MNIAKHTVWNDNQAENPLTKKYYRIDNITNKNILL